MGIMDASKEAYGIVRPSTARHERTSYRRENSRSNLEYVCLLLHVMHSREGLNSFTY